jgi:mono/diheme cytochrome c family protein
VKALLRWTPWLGVILIALIWCAATFGGRGAAPQSSVPASGRELYLASGCAACHGRDGDAKGLVGRNFIPTPTDFRDAGSYRYGADAADIRHAIRAGVRTESSEMPAFAHFSPEELDSLAAYLISLQKPEEGLEKK